MNRWNNLWICLALLLPVGCGDEGKLSPVEEAQKARTTAEEQISEAEDSLDDLDSSLEELEAALKQEQKDNSELKEQLVKVKDERDRLKTELKITQTDLVTAREKLAALDTDNDGAAELPVKEKASTPAAE